jgi:hypothetical protein
MQKVMRRVMTASLHYNSLSWCFTTATTGHIGSDDAHHIVIGFALPMAIFLLFCLLPTGNRRNEMKAVKPVKGLDWDIGAIGTATWGGVSTAKRSGE